jgi:biotin carboxyl carrier protein
MEIEGKSYANVKERRGMIKKFKIRVDGKEYRVEVESVEEERGLEGTTRTINPPGEKTPAEVKKQVVQREPLVAKGKCVVAPMPGAVVKINCRPGEMVKKGDVIIVLEAMKMENEIHSPMDGLVKEVNVKEGMTVSPDEVMVAFE